MKKKITICLLFGCACAAFAMPTVENVQMTQDSASGVVTVRYELRDEPAVITLDVLTNGVSIGGRNLTGLVDPDAGGTESPVNRLRGVGRHTVLWRPTRTWPGHKFANGEVSVSVTAWATNSPPDYMVVDLSAKSNVWYYVSADSLPEGDVTNDVYRTTRLVMRRIRAAGVKWRMGQPSGTRYVTFDEDYYMAVFPMTMRQLELMAGKRGGQWTGAGYDGDTWPVNKISYNDVRGKTFLWPADRHAVDSSSYIGKMRSFAGIDFDLPTEAQREYACRAGTSTAYNNGSDTFTPDIGWVNESQVKPVGMKLSNNWGLYDMHGNVPEWCLDWYVVSLEQSSVRNPDGPDSGTMRVYRGGVYGISYTGYAESYSRHGLDPATSNRDNGFGSNKFNLGFRVVCPAVAK